MRSTSWAALGLLAAAVVAGKVAAQDTGTPQRLDRDAFRAELGLTDEQVAAIRELRTQQRKDEFKRRGDVRAARLSLEQALAAEPIDEAAVAARVKTLGDLEAASARARAESRLALRRLVTAEQYQKLAQSRSRVFGARAHRGRHWRRPAEPGAPSGTEAAPKAPPSGPA
jgi:Spy/CpxP family protein refolding chaperone